jgi:Glycosyltransferase family 87
LDPNNASGGGATALFGLFVAMVAFRRLLRHSAVMLGTLADGSWLTRERLRLVAGIALAAWIILLAWLVATGHGTLDAYGRPLGTDFSDVYAAGRMALDGHAAQAWDWGAHYRVQQAIHHDPAVPFYGWHYPPPFLLLAAPLALLPYLTALFVWQATTLAGAAAVVGRIVPGRTALLVALGAPVVFICLGHGHNGFLTAALLAGALALLDERPVLAGLLLGCLVYKPQFALLIPPLLLVTWRWRAILGAALSAGLLIGATLVIWGWPVWQAFLDSLPLTRRVVIEGGATGWAKIQSPFAMVRMWGGGIAPAYAVQAVATLAAIGLALWLARTARPALRNAAVLAAALLSTPYVLDYDFVVLGMAVAFLAADGLKRGFLSWEKTLLALVWAAPLCARQLAALALVPLGQASAILVLALAVRRAAALDGAFRTSPSRRSRAASGR